VIIKILNKIFVLNLKQNLITQKKLGHVTEQVYISPKNINKNVMKIYHNPRCKKSRAGLQYLEEKNIRHTKVFYLKEEPFTEQSLKNVLNKIGIKAFELIRTQEKIYKDNYKGKNLTENEWIKIMLEFPNLIKRPIIETEKKAVWGDPPSTIDSIL
jgi:arsenate reductase (glutaredoxin)